MRFVTLRPGEVDHEVLWASVGTLALAVSWLWLSMLGPPPVLCPFRTITGLPCPTCGATRAFAALFSGDLPGSLGYNPAVVPALAAGAVAWVYAWVVVCLRLPRIRLSAGPRAARVLRWTIALAAAGFWAVQILRSA